LLHIVAEIFHPWKETCPDIYWPFVATVKLDTFFVMKRKEEVKEEKHFHLKKKVIEERVEHSRPSIQVKWRL
jgi:hypothetical protein